MRFDITLIAALLPSVCLAGVAYGPGSKKTSGNEPQAASLMSTEGGDQNNGLVNDRAGTQGPGNDCGSSTFAEITTGTPEDKPSVEDCRELAKRTAPGDHEWVVPTSGREVVRYNTCGFFATAQGRPGVIGNLDISDLINSSIDKYGSKGFIQVKGGYKMFVVSAGGGLACDNPEHTKGVAVQVDWNISKTNRKD
ncbi:putative necrosis-inducing factor-domain-containing protein [Phyllosticta capitalensis]|uniref:Necrosis-inducing factor-domain-containing protein n=1 Tax=Phyllosticta capitalensis TaxID=121624 RepID=A0ABR1Z051_9PEZI